jgi:hypothetical protein
MRMTRKYSQVVRELLERKDLTPAGFIHKSIEADLAYGLIEPKEIDDSLTDEEAEVILQELEEKACEAEQVDRTIDNHKEGIKTIY